MSLDPVGYTFSGGHAVCSSCFNGNDIDVNNETGRAAAIFNWDDEAVALTCDDCNQTLLEGARYSGMSIDEDDEEHNAWRRTSDVGRAAPVAGSS